MKRWLVMLAICSSFPAAFAQDVKPKPENLTMTLAWIADAGEPKQYVFVINGVVAYRTLDGLKKYLSALPKNSMLTWAPGCCRVGNEPMLGSPEEIRSFEAFCKSIGIKFTLVPAG